MELPSPPASGWRRIVRLIVPILRGISRVFFDPRYLRGRYFDDGLMGWRWVFRALFFQKLLGFNRRVPWPVSPFIVISDYRRIHFDPNDLHNFQTFGCYYQCFGGDIYLGRGVRIAPNVGLITANHDIDNLNGHVGAHDIRIGDNSWIGMNSVILPGGRSRRPAR